MSPARPGALKPDPANAKAKKASTQDGGHSPAGPVDGDQAQDYREIQANEVEALKAIYMDEYEYTESESAWNRSDNSFKLHLKASSDSEVQITLAVTLTATYPKSAPVLSLTGERNIKETALSKINDLIEDKPKELAGQEMIFEIASSIQEVLEDIVHMKAEDALLPSLDQEREAQEAALADVAREKEARVRRKKHQESLEEERILSQMVEKERTRRKEKVDQQEKEQAQESTDDDDAGADDSREKFDRAVSIDTSEGRITFKTVAGFVSLSQGPVTEVFRVRPVSSNLAAKGLSLVLKRAVFQTGSTDSTAWKKALQEFERELEDLRKVDHVNILKLFESKIIRRTSTADPHGIWQVSLLTDTVSKDSLCDLLDVVDILSPDKVRAWSIQLLEAIDYLHRNSIIHKDIHAKNVFLSTSASGEGVIVKLADCGYQQTLHTLQSQADGLTSLSKGSKSAYWFSPELSSARVPQYSRKTDVWDFGVVFLQMIFGMAVVEKYSSPGDFMESLSLSEQLSEMVVKFFTSDPKKRPTAFELLPCEFLRENAPVYEITRNLSRRQSGLMLSATRTGHGRKDSIGIFPGSSRYATDFVEAGRLGKGGFGEVVKARNKLDFRFYAVKKITQASGSALTDVLSETMLLSRLNHPYVVRYFTAWVEEDFSKPVTDVDDEDAVSIESSSTQHDGNTGSQFVQSTGGLDFISSRGYSNIQFGYDTNERQESSEDDLDAETEDDNYRSESESGEGSSQPINQLKRPTLMATRTRSSSRSQPGLRTILYIQMEYCEKQTLRDLIRRGLYDDMDEVWRLFRQVVEGLSHIHSHGIIHRDLKPDNIFIDQNNNPRIGDFGLATSGQYNTGSRGILASGTGDDMTTDVGTTLYVAPELDSAAKGQYNDKVDMYSLGIIFFEMCFPLKTAMERDFVVRELRQKDYRFPEDFHSEKRALAEELIISLVSHKPSERPSSSELLSGGKLPVKVEDETIRQALAGMSDSESPYYQKVMSTLFSQPIKQVKEFTWDMGTIAHGSNELLLQTQVKEQLISIFRHHGAVESSRPLLFPRSPFYTSNVVQVMDPSGILLQLPFDLTLPHARAIARQLPPAQKSYAFGNVYRDLGTGGQPASHGEVDFDIVSYDSLDLALKEAEVIKVVDEVVNGFPSLQSAQMCFHINHSDLLELIMEFCRIEKPQRHLVKEVLSKLNTGGWTWQKIRNELRSVTIGVSSTSLDDLASFDFRDHQDKAFQQLRAIFEGSDVQEQCAPIFSHLSTVISYLRAFGVRRKIYVSPLSTFNDKFYTGDIVFQCLYDTKRREVFAAGGRYDRLIRQHRPKGQAGQSECHAVGFNLAWESLFTSMARYQKDLEKKNFLKKAEVEPGGHWLSRRCDVLVASLDAVSLRSVGVRLLADLWSMHISAELAVDARSPDQLLSRYKDDRHSWIIMIKRDHADYGHDRGLKVKSMLRKEDTDLRMSGLLSWLRNEIRERDQSEHTYDNKARMISKSALGQDSFMADVDEHRRDVQIISPVQKNKTNRKNITIAADNRTKQVVKGIVDNPVLAVEMKEDQLEAIRESRLADPDSWKRLIQNVPSEQRRYFSEIHEHLLDLAKNPQTKSRNVLIYDYKTAHCICYDLGRMPKASQHVSLSLSG